MERLVPILNQLQSVLGILGSHSISLPQLVVVGSQSSGKSSVLENVVGRDFLPRGNNIVTRRPLVLQLYNTSVGGDPQDTKEWGEFDHIPDKRFYDFSEIKREIVAETDRLVGKGSGISSTPIYLRIHSPHVPTLTLVDLPGITKVPTGDQPVDIEKQIRKMVMHFISNPNAIIVAVSTATEDIANSEALKVAREIDPHGARTLGVITKLDLMDQGTDAREVLLNRVIPLQLGFVGVVNRSQRDINEGKPIHAALQAEQAFFANSVYSGMSSRMGTGYLTQRLSSLLLGHLQTHLPSIKQQVIATIQETEKELVSYGNPLGIDAASYAAMVQEAEGEPMGPDTAAIPKKLQGPILLDIMSKFSSHYTSALEGRSTGAFADVATQQLYGGARIAFVFHEVFGGKVDSVDPFDHLTDTEIRTAIRNATGPRPTLFLPEMSFEILVKKQIERLRQPVLECVDLVLDELLRVATQCQLGGLPQLARFPALKSALMACVKGLLLKRLQPTKAMVANLVNIELAYINTNHPDFIGGSRALTQLAIQRKQKHKEESSLNASQAPSSGSHKALLQSAAAEHMHQQAHAVALNNGLSPALSSSSSPSAASAYDPNVSMSPYGVMTSEALRAYNARPPSERELIETEVIKLLIASYFSIVKKTIKDTVPKTIMYLLVNKTKQDIQSELVAALYKEDHFDDLLREAADIGEKRDSCVKLLAIMRKALEVVNRIKDTTI